MPVKMARSAPRPPSGLPKVTVAVRIALLPCRKAGKTRAFTPVRGHLENPGQERQMGGVRPNARENGQISPSTTVRASRGAGNRRHLASVLRQGRKTRILTPVWESSGESRFKLNPPIYAGGPVQLLFPWSGSVPFGVGKTGPAQTLQAQEKRTRPAKTVTPPHLPVPDAGVRGPRRAG